MFSKEKVQEAFNENFTDADYLITSTYSLDINKEVLIRDVENYIECLRKMVEIFYDEKQKIKYFYAISKTKKKYVINLVVENYLDKDKMSFLKEWFYVRNIKSLENLGSYLMKDKEEVRYSKDFFKGININ
ncbi:hypothetical protein ELS18_13875 [Clostridium perfringens]|uniref:hypothetical protein n=1 Tax=Clostridium perfringens TaxID=1502 RepID=UPI000F8E8084|nr:hypothetical protein [Clostridium perfringens]RUR35112.1 hypothetical protein ELS18_13875 [Clostridium perfringens]